MTIGAPISISYCRRFFVHPVATGDGGYQIHREQRYPGAHPVAREQPFASTGSAFGRGGWALWSPPASLERRVFPLGTALPARVSQLLGAVQCRLEHKLPQTCLVVASVRLRMCWTEDSSLKTQKRSRISRCSKQSE